MYVRMQPNLSRQAYLPSNAVRWLRITRVARQLAQSAVLATLFHVTALVHVTALATQPSQTQTLISFDGGFEMDSANMDDVELKVARAGNFSVLRVATGHTSDWPGITVKAPKHPWDLSKYAEIVLNVTNIELKASYR